MDEIVFPQAQLFGWSPELLPEAFEMFGPFIMQMPMLDYPKRMMLWEITRKVLGKDTENYAQQIGDPYVKDTMVLMADGTERAIQDVKIGEKVLNHKNEIATVTNVIKKNFTGDIVTVKLRGYHRTVSATETHHGLVLPFSTYRFKYSGVEAKKFGDVKVGEWMLIPFGKNSNENIQVLDLANILTDFVFDDEFVYYHPTSKITKKIKRFVNIDSDFAWLVGMYLAEGGLTNGSRGVTFSLNVNETDYMEKISNLCKKIFGVETSIQRTGVESCRRVYVKSYLFGQLFKKLIPGNIYSKTVPTLFFNVDPEVRKSLLMGWLDGDGQKIFNVNSVIGYTSSDKLGDDITRLALTCGLNPKSWIRDRKIRSSKPSTEVAFYGTEPYKIFIDVKPAKEPREITCNDTPYGFARPITNIDRRYTVDEEVYCIVTENEYSIIVNGIAGKNCVSFGSKNACEYLQAFQLKEGDHSKWRPVFPPYIYGISRVQIGGGRLGNSDGSVGVWATQGLVKYGCLFADEPNVPKYAGSVAKSWGRSGPPKEFIEIGSKHLLKMDVQTAQVKTWDQLCSAIGNGYPVTVASNYGFQMGPSSDGFHAPQGSWAHQMCIIAYDHDPEPYAIILNSWGNAHGSLKDFKTGETLPIGVLRVRKKTIERMLVDGGGDSWAYSNLDLGFVERLPASTFDMF